MANLADDHRASGANGSQPDVRPELVDLAERMRGTVTPVVGYLELISQEVNGVASERYLQWISTIERRLDAVRETSDQISRICDVLRRSINDPEGRSRPQASMPGAPEALED